MKFSTSSLIALAAVSVANGFVINNQKTFGVVSPLSMSTEVVEDRKPSKKEKRLQFMKDDRFYRKGFKDVRDDVENEMQEKFKSDIVDELKGSQYVIEKDGVKVHLAKVSKVHTHVVD